VVSKYVAQLIENIFYNRISVNRTVASKKTIPPIME